MEQVLILGNPVDGFTYYGPLKEEHDADWLANNYEEWHVANLYQLDDEDGEN